MSQLIKCHYNNDIKHNIISKSFQKSSKDHNSKNDNYNDNYNDNDEYSFGEANLIDNDNKPDKLEIFLFYLFHLPFMFYVYPLYLFSKFLLNYKDNFLKYYKDLFNLKTEI